MAENQWFNPMEFTNESGIALNDENLNALQRIINAGIQKACDSYCPLGTGKDYYGTTEPENFMFADGRAVSREEYSELFAVIGTQYGAGDGSTTFNIPDKRERVSIMYKSGSSNGTSGATLGTLGAKGGEFKHKIATTEMPSHKHKLNDNTVLAYHKGLGTVDTTGQTIGRVYDNLNSEQIYTDSAGGTNSMNIMQPYLVCNYIIRVK